VRSSGYDNNHRGSILQRFRFPQEIIAHAVWISFRFSLSYRDVEELLAERRIIVSSETIRQWTRKFGQTYANQLRRRRARPGDKWFLDEVFLKITGKTSYLWRAVDQNGNVLDILVQSRRNKAAAKKFLAQGGTPAAQRLHVHPARDHHRQAGQLRGCQDGSHAERRAPSA
jgi:transposase-like protein